MVWQLPARRRRGHRSNAKMPASPVRKDIFAHLLTPCMAPSATTKVAISSMMSLQSRPDTSSISPDECLASASASPEDHRHVYEHREHHAEPGGVPEDAEKNLPLCSAGRPAWPETDEQAAALALGLAAFGVDSLRPHQREALRLLFAGESVAQCVRTGGGKSLVPMLWAWLRRYHPRLFPGRSSVLVAFFPTNVLKRDMERRARAGGLSVFASPSYGDHASHDDPPTRPQPRCEATLRELPSADFIVLTVEFFFGLSSRAASLAWFLKEQSQRSRVFFWVDEADAAIVSSRTYRPSQKRLGELSALHPTAQLLLSSATLSPEMMRAASSFYCSGASTFRIVRSEIDRPNLYFSVMRNATTKVNAYDDVFCELCNLYRLRSQGGEWAGAHGTTVRTGSCRGSHTSWGFSCGHRRRRRGAGCGSTSACSRRTREVSPLARRRPYSRAFLMAHYRSSKRTASRRTTRRC